MAVQSAPEAFNRSSAYGYPYALDLLKASGADWTAMEASS